MTHTTIMHIRIDVDLKENAEAILAQLGLTSSEAVKLFYKQIELNGGLPFELKVPEKIFAESKHIHIEEHEHTERIEGQ